MTPTVPFQTKALEEGVSRKLGITELTCFIFCLVNVYIYIHMQYYKTSPSLRPVLININILLLLYCTIIYIYIIQLIGHCVRYVTNI